MQGPFAATGELMILAGCKPGEIAPVLAALGYRAVTGESGITFARGKKTRQLHRREAPSRPDSPFAALQARFGARAPQR